MKNLDRLIPLSAPFFSKEEEDLVQACVASSWVSSAGGWLDRFEKKLEEICEVPQSVVLNSGTSALHLALMAVGVQPGDLVLIPNLTFVATANAISYLSARPILVDVDPAYWQMDLNILQDFFQLSCTHTKTGLMYQGSRIAAVVPVHLLGYPMDVVRLKAICASYDIPIIEDATEALGSKLHGNPMGSFGTLGCLSFNGNKIITTGGGGAVLGHHKELVSKIRHWGNQAKQSGSFYFHDQIGYNYRLTGLQASLGIAQLNKLEEILKRKSQIHSRYQEAFPKAVWPEVLPASNPNYWLNTLLVNAPQKAVSALEALQIQARPLWFPMNKLPMYKDCLYLHRKNYSQYIHQHALSIPSSAGLSKEEQERVIAAVGPHILHAKNL